MKIVHIITRLIVGGAQENTLISCQGQHDLGHEVVLLTGPPLGPEGSLMPRASAGGYRVVQLPHLRRAAHPWRDWLAYRQMVRFLREFSPDIVHTHSSKAGILGRRAARAAGCRGVVHTIHGLAFTASRWRVVNDFYRWAERRAAPWSDRIVCVADAMARQSLAANIGRAEQYVTVYSGMETAGFLHPPVDRQSVRRSLGIEPVDIVVGTIARLFDLKGHEDLLELAPRLCAAHPRLRFMWVGDGSRRGEFEARIGQMNLRDRFILTGLVPPARIPELAGAMDILAHPSRREGLARALAQGSLAGKPIIGYDIDGNAEAMLPGQSGLLIAPFDVAALGAGLSRLAADALLREHMGQCGRRFALERFDSAVMVRRLHEVYQQVRDKV